MENEKSEKEIKDNSNVSLLAIVIIAILLSILTFFIIVPRKHQLTPRMICGTNMSGLGKAMMIYVNDFDQYPTPEKWCDLLIEKCEVSAKIFRCPSAKEGPCNYALNKYIADMGPTSDPDIVVFFETYPGWNQVGGPEILTTENHEGDGCNVVFLDSHVEFIYTRNIHKLKWKPD